MKRVISAGAVIFRREQDGGIRFLLLYYGRGYWNFPKGKIEQGERATGAFIREVEEETGLRRQDLKIVPGFRASERFTFADRYADRHERRGQRPMVFKVVIYYLVESRKREVVISDEHEGFGWFTLREALHIAKYKNTQGILRQAHEFIQRNLPRTTTRVPHHRERR